MPVDAGDIRRTRPMTEPYLDVHLAEPGPAPPSRSQLRGNDQKVRPRVYPPSPWSGRRLHGRSSAVAPGPNTRSTITWTVAEAVEGLMKGALRGIVAPDLPNGKKAGGHLALADCLGRQRDIRVHRRQARHLTTTAIYAVMTNSPTSTSNWRSIPTGKASTASTSCLERSSADRFVRMSWALGAAPKEKDPGLAVATAFSLIRSISVPLGLADPDKPNIAATIWRTVSDTGARRYYWSSAYSPSIFWVDLAKLKLAPGSAPARLDLSGRPILDGEVSDKFVATEPFQFLSH